MKMRWMVATLLAGAAFLIAAPALADDVAAVPGMHLVVSKTPNPGSVPEPGADVTFSIAVSNTSGVPISLDRLTDTDFGDLDGQGTCDVSPPVVLAPGGSYSCTFVGAVVGDASGPDHQNTVTARATVVGSSQVDTATATATVVITDVLPQIKVDKIADPPVVRPGATITYSFAVTNPGTEPLQAVTVTDDKCAPLTFLGGDTDSDSRLDRGETWRYRCTTPVSVDTINVATATGSDDDGNMASDDDEAQVDVIDPSVNIDKTASPISARPGQTVTYSYLVTNEGDEPLSDVVVTDDKCSPVKFVSGDTDGDGMLDLTETWAYSCTITASATAGNLTNTGTVVGTDRLGGTVTDTDDATITVVLAPPVIEIDKTVNRPVVRVGDSVIYSYVVTNGGAPVQGMVEPLLRVTVTDDKCSPVTFVSGDTDGDSQLDAGETWLYTCTTTISADTTNTGTAVGFDGLGNRDDARDTALVEVIDPRVNIDKTASPISARPGQTVTYSYLVTNQGDDPLSNVVVTDDKCSPVKFVSGDADGDSMLDLTETWAYSCTITASATAGNLTNTGTVVGTDRLGGTVTDSDDFTITVVLAPPVIEIDKTVNRPVVRVGDSVIYSYAVTNGGVPVQGVVEPVLRVTVTDDKCSPVTFVSGDTDGDSQLDAGETWRYTCTTTISVDTTNTGTAVGFDSLGNRGEARDTAFVDVIDPRINIDKTASPKSVVVGEKVTYTYVVTNPGDEALSGVVVTDDKCGAATYLAGDTNGDGKLDPGERWTFSCTLIASENDGVNVGTAAGTDRLGGPVKSTDTETITLTLPVTGATTTGWTVLGSGLILLGALLLLLGRPARPLLGRP